MYWSMQRDAVLRSTVLHESIWGSAVRIATTKVASQGWKAKGDFPVKIKRAHELLLSLDGKGWVKAIGKGVRDYLTCDNGEWWEIVRASSAVGSQVLGLMHLDSLRCHRTGDPSRPVYYRDLKGGYHELKDYQVINLTDQPSPGAEWLDVGLCAATSAYGHIYKLAAIERYISEKITGSRPQEIHMVSGVNRKMLEAALAAADEGAAEKGMVSFKGAVVIPMLQGQEVSGYRIPLAELPDGFDRKQEFDLAITAYADAIGLDQQDLQPLSGQGLGSGTQSRVLAEKAKGKGLAARGKQWIHEINEKVFPEGVTFVFVERDLDDELKQASVLAARAGARTVMIQAGEITALEARQLAVDVDDLPKEFAPPEGDTTPEGSLSDDEKPMDGVVKPLPLPVPPATPEAQPAQAPAAPPRGAGVVAKESGIAMLLEEVRAARKALAAARETGETMPPTTAKQYSLPQISLTVPPQEPPVVHFNPTINVQPSPAPDVNFSPNIEVNTPQALAPVVNFSPTIEVLPSPAPNVTVQAAAPVTVPAPVVNVEVNPVLEVPEVEEDTTVVRGADGLIQRTLTRIRRLGKQSLG
jgi:hypothetical protein